MVGPGVASGIGGAGASVTVGASAGNTELESMVIATNEPPTTKAVIHTTVTEQAAMAVATGTIAPFMAALVTEGGTG